MIVQYSENPCFTLQLLLIAYSVRRAANFLLFKNRKQDISKFSFFGFVTGI